MSDSKKQIKLGAFVQLLEKIAPTRLAGSWDNVGLLVEPYTKRSISKIAMTIDLTEEVLQEALDYGADLVISYHPPIFRAFKRLTRNSAKERIILRAIETGTAVYSPHTAWDAQTGGINDWLVRGLGDGKVSVVETRSVEGGYRTAVVFASAEGLPDNTISEIKNEIIRTSRSAVTLSDRQVEKKSSQQVEQIFEFNTSKNIVAKLSEKLTNILKQSDDYDNSSISYQVTQLCDSQSSTQGMGRILELEEPQSLASMIEKIKQHLGLEHVRIARPTASGADETHMIKSIAACAGSGGSVIGRCSVDLLLTGEMSHHDVLAAIAKGTSVILCEHTNTERGYLKEFKNILEAAIAEDFAKYSSPSIMISQIDEDPLKVV